MTTQSSQASVDEPGPEQTNRPKDDFFTKLRRVDMRRTSDSWVGGVCAGLGHRVGLDPLVIRAGAVLLGIFFGLGLFAYLLAWFLIPDSNEQTHAEMGLSGGRGSSIFLFVVTVLVGLGGLTTGVFGWSNFSFAAIAVTIVIGWALWYVWTRRPETGAVSQRAYSPPPPPSTDVMADPVRGDAGRPSPGPRQYVGSPVSSPPPRTPRRKGPGGPITLAVLGLAVIAAGAIVLALSSQPLVGLALGGLAGLVVVGTALVILGIQGRRAGFLGFVAGTGLLVAPLAVMGGYSFDRYEADFVTEFNSEGFYVNTADSIFVPSDPSEKSFQSGAGNVVLDLTGLSPSELEGYEPTLDVSAGDVLIMLPAEQAGTVNVAVSAGEVFASGFGEDVDGSTGGVFVDRTFVIGTGDGYDLSVDVTAGTVQIDAITTDEGEQR